MTVHEHELSSVDLSRYRREGYFHSFRALTVEQVEITFRAIESYLSRKLGYELTDPVRFRRVSANGEQPRYEYEPEAPAIMTTFPFLFNIWKCDERILEIAKTPAIVRRVQQVLGRDRILLMEDNVVIKNPNTGSVPWHQDYAYWPIANPDDAVTVWIALDSIGPANGAMQVAPGSQFAGERLPVWFKDGSSFMQNERPGIRPVPQDPTLEGYPIITYEILAPGQCAIHSSLVWHGSTPNTTANIRRALVLRYVAEGAGWLGESRFPYDNVGCPVGGTLTSDHFPLVVP